MTANQSPKKRRLVGTVVSDKMAKTVVVEIERMKMHRLYKKPYRARARVHADDPKNEYKIGERVVIEETRPLSKTKRWRVVRRP